MSASAQPVPSPAALAKLADQLRITLGRIADSIVEAVALAGPAGVPESAVYLAIAQHGGTIEHHRAFVDVLIATGRLRRAPGPRLVAA